ncbi:MAG: hypothetical protein N2441_06780 [Rhodocyclaceae bacterium]|nr:hypothetical protein [Rhodocyclaceae bacterium]
MAGGVLLRFVNHLLAQGQWARTLLAAHAGRVAALRLPFYDLCFVILPNGFCEPVAQEKSPTPDVLIELPASAPLRLHKGLDAVLSEAHVTGQADFAQALLTVFRHLSWDAEEDLARFCGDILAHRLFALARAASQTTRLSLGRLLEQGVEYAVHEAQWLVSPAEFRAFSHELEGFAAHLYACEKRLEHLATMTLRRRSP